jgi:hypothetical protein
MYSLYQDLSYTGLSRTLRLYRESQFDLADYAFSHVLVPQCRMPVTFCDEVIIDLE